MTVSTTATWTENDIRQVYSRLHADLHMIAESTGLWTEEWVDSLVYDLTLLAILDYLSKIDVYLVDSSGAVLQAEQYTPSTDASSWTAQRPSCRWPRVANTRVELHVNYTADYRALTPVDLQSLKSKLKLPWSPASSLDLSGLNATEERTYSSNGYGLRRVSLR